MDSRVLRFGNGDDAPPATWKEMFSGKDKIMVSATASYSDDQPRHPRILRITMQFPPHAPCGLVKNADGTTTVRPILDSGKRLEILREVLKNNLHLPEKNPNSDSTPVPTKQSRSVSDPENAMEVRLKESKRKLIQQYKSIEDRRKRIKVIDSRDVPVSPEKPNYFRRRPVVNIKRR